MKTDEEEEEDENGKGKNPSDNRKDLSTFLFRLSQLQYRICLDLLYSTHHEVKVMYLT